MTYVVKKLKSEVIDKVPGVDFLQREVINPLKKAAPVLSYPEKLVEGAADIVQKPLDWVNDLVDPKKQWDPVMGKAKGQVTTPTATPTATDVVQQQAADSATNSAAARAAAKRRAAALALARGGRASTILSQGSEVIPAVGLGGKGNTLG